MVMASLVLIFNLSIISHSMVKQALFDQKKRKAEQAWKEVEPLKDQMAQFLAEKTRQKLSE